MADPFGFMKYPRVNNPIRPVAERIKDFEEMETFFQSKNAENKQHAV